MKVVKSLLIVVGAILIVIVVGVGLLALKMHNEISAMTPVATGELTDGIYAVNDDGYVNLFMIAVEEKFIAIDAGDSVENVERELTRLGIEPEKVTALFLTHSDSDHVGTLSLFPNATVYLSRAEEQMINGTTARALGFFRNSLERDYTALDDGLEITIDGVTIKGILSPGHTPGAMCYLVNSKYLFTGDVISLKEGKVELFNNFFSMDTAQERASIKMLAEIKGVEYLFTAHYGFSDNAAQAFAAWH
ncbi:MAG: MBL fold metallo-hydrolase [Myxococcota bacterium]|nr:MBL fold metallo-hydrolase [Myxococcota bacterium]